MANDPPMAANSAPSSRLPKAANDVLEAAAAFASAGVLGSLHGLVTGLLQFRLGVIKPLDRLIVAN